MSEGLAEQFWSKVDKAPGHGLDGDCWVWTGATTHRGYGRLWRRMATHIALEADGRPQPEGLFALHSCDNPPCCNPAHLRWGTHADNMQDMVSRKRHHANSRDFCIHGHELVGDNLHIRPNGQRRCKTCQNRLRTESKVRVRSEGRPKVVSPVRITEVSDYQIMLSLKGIGQGSARHVATGLGMIGVAAAKAVYRRLTELEKAGMVKRGEKVAGTPVVWSAAPLKEGE